MLYYRFVLVLCTAFSCAVIPSSGQVSDGFIIQSDGNYRYGQVSLNTQTQYEAVLFKGSLQTDFTKYSVETILGYGVINGVKFVTKEISVGEKVSQVFLKIEFEGLAKLYSYHDRFFVEKESLIEIRQSDFEQVITELFKDCKSFSRYKKTLKFTQKKLYEAFKGYNECISADSKFVPAIEFSFDALMGVELNTTTLSADAELSFVNSQKLKDRTLFTFGFTANVSVPKLRGICLSTGLNFYDQKFYVIVNNGTAVKDKLNLDYMEFLVPLNIQYTPPLSSKFINPYLKGGFSIPFTTEATMKWEHEEDTGSIYYFDGYDFSATVKQSLILNVSAGAYFSVFRNEERKGFFEISYQKTNGEIETPTNNIKLTGNRINLLVGIRF